MRMKADRQAMIQEIIETHAISTQEELAAALEDRGVRVTQATVSRDIKEMRLLKVMSKDGTYHYVAAEQADAGLNDRLIRMLTESVLNVASAGNMIVLKTLSGTANAACEALDGMHWTEVLGTLAGDNTIFMVIRSEEDVPAVVDRIYTLLR